MHKVLLFGPIVAKIDDAYGGGTGGYTRKMLLYLNFFEDDEFQIVPCYHSIRGQSKKEILPLRLFTDIWTFLKSAKTVKPKIVHILAQYRTAIYREFFIVLITKLLKKRIVYEIKAGVFLTWFESTNSLSRHLCMFCLNQSDIILCQGLSYVRFLDARFKEKVFFHPNFVPVQDVPATIDKKLNFRKIKVLFVGFQFKEKGVFELVEACSISSLHFPIELTLVGKEHEEFKSWLDKLEIPESLRINRIGQLPHEELNQYFHQSDVYCYPTRHSGEGHNNTINEAMMMGMVIVTTRQGFLSDVLDTDSAYFLDDASASEISSCLLKINTEREIARTKGLRARDHLINNYTSGVVFKNLKYYYKSLV